MLGILIPLLIFGLAFFAIRHFTVSPGGPQTPGRISHQTARLLYWILAVVVLLWLLAALGVFGTIAHDPVRPF